MKKTHTALYIVGMSTLFLQAEYPVVTSPKTAIAHITCFLTDKQYTVEASFRDMCLLLAEQLAESPNKAEQKLGNTLAGIAHERSLRKIVEAMLGYQALFLRGGRQFLDLSTLKIRLETALNY